MTDDPRYQRFNLRIPRELFAKLQMDAEKHSRSMNAEIIEKLNSAVSPYGHLPKEMGMISVPDRPNRITTDYDKLLKVTLNNSERIEEFRSSLESVMKLLQEQIADRGLTPEAPKPRKRNRRDEGD